MATKKKTRTQTQNKPQTAPAPVAPAGGVTLDATKYGGIRDMRARMDTLVPAVADLTLKIKVLEAQLAKVTGEYLELDNRLGESIRAAAAENGVQLEGQNWSFNIPTLTFSRMQ